MKCFSTKIILSAAVQFTNLKESTFPTFLLLCWIKRLHLWIRRSGLYLYIAEKRKDFWETRNVPDWVRRLELEIAVENWTKLEKTKNEEIWEEVCEKVGRR
jgi:hypothetical protein